MRLILYFALPALLLLSCERHNDTKNKLIGSWLDTSPTPLHFTLNTDGSAETYNTQTTSQQKWFVQSDSIVFVKTLDTNKGTEEKTKFKIKKITTDSLVLESNKRAYVFIKNIVNKENLVGKWIDNSGAGLDFELKENNIASPINNAMLYYKNWQLKNDSITFTIESIEGDSTTRYQEQYKIIKSINGELILKNYTGIFSYNAQL